MSENNNLQKYKVRTIYVKLPEFVYDKLLKYKMVYRLDEIIVNHLIDVIENHEAKRSDKIQEELEGLDEEVIPELVGMVGRKEKKIGR